MICGQDAAITSPVPGTTTDVVEKTMELLPLGPVVFLDTAGIDDHSVLSKERTGKTMKIFNRADIAVILTEPNIFGEYEAKIIDASRQNNIPFMIIVNKTDLMDPDASFIKKLKEYSDKVMFCSSLKGNDREKNMEAFKKNLAELLPEGYLSRPMLIGDLVPPGGIALLIVPIDLEAPKGRLILPQVQTIRDALDSDASVVIVKEREYPFMLENLKRAPDIVVCDSQVVQKMVADTPLSIPCTTFSILFARYKGELNELVRGLTVIDHLQLKDKILIAEACSHHALQDDIGRVKIPRWLRQYTGLDLQIDTISGRDYPDNLNEYRLVIHCGACMLTPREMLLREKKASSSHVSITNYGLCISFLQGVIKRVLSPFPAALDILNTEVMREHKKKEVSPF
jgi:[FeFe] hydrogenase H-cluster maturation GTPase HydF